MVRTFLPTHILARTKHREFVLKFLKDHKLLEPVVVKLNELSNLAKYVVQCPIGCSPLLLMVLSKDGTFVTKETNNDGCVYRLNNNYNTNGSNDTTVLRVRYAEKVAGSPVQLAYPQSILFWKGVDVRNIDTADSFRTFNMHKIPGIREAVVYNPDEDMASLVAVPRSLFLIGKCPSENVCIPILPATTAPLVTPSNSKKEEENMFLMEQHPKKLPDVYFLRSLSESSSKTSSLAVIPDIETSELCRQWWSSKTLGQILVRAVYVARWKRWKPVELCETTTPLPPSALTH